MLDQLRNRHLLLLDVVLLILAKYASYVLRLERLNIEPFWESFFLAALVSSLLTIIIFYRIGIYSRYWRYASVNELLLLAGGVTIATFGAAMITLLVAYLFWEGRYPRSTPLIFSFLAIGVTAAPRLLLRMANDRRPRYAGIAQQAVLIMGAGDAGAMIVQEFHKKPGLGKIVVGFVDDDPSKYQLHIHGVPVLGGRQDIPHLVQQYQIGQVVIAMPAVPGKEIRQIVSICEQAGVQTKIIPGIYELLDGTVHINQLRDVDIEDLLRREPVQTDTASVYELVAGKRVLVTGGGGSIGSELCRQILRFTPAQLIIVGHGENSIFDTFHSLKQVAPSGVTVEAIIADIRFPKRIQQICQQYRPQIIFHAAAHKHVPLMELNPSEAITNNVLGTRHLLEAALDAGVERFVMISTDKAVNPTSIMGASKRAAELLVHRAAQQSRKPYVAVRFGNVLGSRGSVVLTFKKQIAQGGPITITHPEMKRFFMTIPEAVQLVLQAAVLGKGGEVFLLDMGEPIKILDLAHDLVELSGLEVGRDIDIVFSGIRPGEKLFEELFVPGESYQHTRHEKIFIAGNANSFVPENLDDSLEALETAANRSDDQAIIRALQQMIPEYAPIYLAAEDAGKTIPIPYAPPTPGGTELQTAYVP